MVLFLDERNSERRPDVMKRFAFVRALAGVVLAVMFLVSSGACAFAASVPENRSAAPFRYRTTKQGVEITEYTGRNESNVTVPEYIDDLPVIRICNYAFTDYQEEKESGYQYCVPRTDIEYISLPSTLKSIGDFAFDSLQGLASIEIPDSVTEMGVSAFGNCAALAYVKLPANLAEVSESAFENCALATVDLPSGVVRIQQNAFAGNRSLTSVEFPRGLQSIGSGAFGACLALESVQLPESLRTIGTSAFGSTGLKSVTVPAGVSEVQPGAFMWCESLETVRFAGIPTRIGRNAFLDCRALRTSQVDGDPEEWQQVSVEPEGNDALLNAEFDFLSGGQQPQMIEPQPAVSAQPEPQDSKDPEASLASAGYTVSVHENSPLTLMEKGGEIFALGFTAAAGGAAVSDQELIGQFDMPADIAVSVSHVSRANGGDAAPLAATGDKVLFEQNGAVVGKVTFVLEGDVLGSGVMSLSQIVRLASALTGKAPLEGAYLEAGDFTKTGDIRLSDVVAEAKLLRKAQAKESA